jgi:hypothetical protein
MAASIAAAHPLRARGWSEQGVRWSHRRRANFPFYLFAGGVAAIDRSIDVDRPFSNTPNVTQGGRTSVVAVR